MGMKPPSDAGLPDGVIPTGAVLQAQGGISLRKPPRSVGANALVDYSVTNGELYHWLQISLATPVPRVYDDGAFKHHEHSDLPSSQRSCLRCSYFRRVFPFPALLGAVSNAQAVAPTAPADQGLKPILDYISSAWDTLTRSMTDCASVVDPKINVAPGALFAKGGSRAGGGAKIGGGLQRESRTFAD